MTKNLILGPILGHLAQMLASKFVLRVLHLVVVTHCSKLSCYAISRKTNEQDLRKWPKTWFWTWFWSFWPKFAPPPHPQFFFLDKMAKNVILGPIFVCFGPNVVPKSFLRGFYLYWMLYIVASYHCMQFQVKLMNQTWENGKKPSFGLDFDPFCPNLGPNFFSWILPVSLR